jgi:hypothetical protein
MASNLRVDQILPTVGTNVAIGTATGTVTLAGTTSGTFSGNLTGNATGLSGSPTLSGITSVSTTNLTVNGNAYPSSGPLSNRNKIINGAMVVDQRNAGIGTVISGDGYVNRKFPVDRFNIQKNSTCVISGIQTSDVPTGQGFNYALKAQVTTADASIAAADYALVNYRCEGYDVADFQFGTASAKTITLSFWVKSSISGTYGFSLTNYADNRSIPINYSINSADTWEYKTITISGDTTGTWEKTNSGGMNIQWALGFGTDYEGTNNTWTGSVKLGTSSKTQLISTLNATFYLTGVQLEVGTVATPFEHRSYGDELARCQRYCQTLGGEQYKQIMVATRASASIAKGTHHFVTSMRAAPSLTSSGSGTLYYQSGDLNLGSDLILQGIWTGGTDEKAAWVDFTGTVGGSNGNFGFLYCHTSSTYKLIFSAEL